MGNELATCGGGLRDQIAYANAVCKAGIIPPAYQNRPADIIVAMGFGQAMGLSPAESLYRINVIKGKPTMSAELIAAQVRKAGHKLRIEKDAGAVSATATIVRCDDSDYPISVTRDQAWAQSMGLNAKDNYRKQPLTMLTWRAVTACAREACPEALFGIAYTPDEMHDLDNAPQGPQDRAQGPLTPSPVQAPAQVETPSQNASDGPVSPLAEISARKDAYKAKTGCTDLELNRALCEYAGVASLREATPEQVELCVGYMDEIIELEVMPGGC